MERVRPQAWALLPLLLGSPTALACPDCPTSQVVRASVLGEGFWSYLLLAALPFLLIGALGALLYRVGLPGRQPYPEPERPRPGEPT